MSAALATTSHARHGCWTRLAAHPSAGPGRAGCRGSTATDAPSPLAREHGGPYDPGPRGPGGDAGAGDDGASDNGAGHGEVGGDAQVGAGLRDAVAAARHAVARVLQAASDEHGSADGQVAALLELLGVVDTANAAAVELTTTIRRRGLAERSTGLPLESLLSFQSRATYGDRATLCNVAEQLAGLPHLRAAFHAGVVGWAQVRGIVAEIRPLSAAQRTELDHGFADHARLARLEPDRLLDTVTDEVARLRPDLETERARRTIEHRYLALQPALDGAGTGYFELDATAYGPVAAAIQAAMPAPAAGANDTTTHALGEADDTDTAGRGGPGVTSDGDPAFCDHLEDRSRARQRADALVRLAEVFLAGPTMTRPHRTDGDTGADGDRTAGQAGRLSPGLRRARPSLQAICDIHHLTGHDEAATTAARALIATTGGTVRLTPEGVRRLACDAHLQLVLTHRGQILGTTDPTGTIPAAVRRALWARDQGCRFPGCTAPIHWTDAHHIRYRRHGGPTTADNLVLLCRRHHTAVHDGGWRLSMAPDGTITVRRGRRHATSDPPLNRRLHPT